MSNCKLIALYWSTSVYYFSREMMPQSGLIGVFGHILLTSDPEFHHCTTYTIEF